MLQGGLSGDCTFGPRFDTRIERNLLSIRNKGQVVGVLHAVSTRPPVRDLLTVRLPVEPEIRMLPPVLEAKAADCPVCDIEREAPV